MTNPEDDLQFATRAIHVGVYKDSAYNSVTTPIYPTSTFRWEDLETTKGYDYTRSGNPTRSALEENIASLEKGIECRATSTGMSAIAAALHLFKPGDHIISGDDIYGGTYRLFDRVFGPLGVEFTFVKMSDPEKVRAALKPNTKGIWIETPSNPLLQVFDIAAIVAIAKSANAITIADNTFLSPYLQRPHEFGVDVVVHSTTKYLNGHSDVVGGCIVTKDRELADRVSFLVNALGLACSPFDAWLVLRGIKTLAPRMEAHQRSAQALAEMLEANADRKSVV
jgi:cystathionine beta-lyase/cystathionine gamma-synthase